MVKKILLTWLLCCFNNHRNKCSSQFVQRDSYAECGICRHRVSVCLCVCVCVCVSVTLRYFIKTAKRRITQTTPHVSPMTLSFLTPKTMAKFERDTTYGGDKCKWGGLKLVTFDKKRTITRKRYKIDV